jgi:zinc transport system permease protein
MALILNVTAGILLILSLIYKKLVYVTFDEEQAEAAGIRVRSINYLFIILSSITVIASIKLVGVLLISSLIVIPNVTALTLRKGFRTTMYISCIISSGSVILGIIVSYIANISPSGAIVLTNTAIFFSFLVGRYLKRKIQNSKLELTAPKVDI